MSATAKRALWSTIVLVAMCVAIGLYIGLYLVNVPGSVAAVQTSSGTQLYLATVPAVEPNDPHNTWVSYYAVDANSQNCAMPSQACLPMPLSQRFANSWIRKPMPRPALVSR